MGERYINISIPPEAHAKLKRLAKAKKLPMARYIAAMVQFFSHSGRDPEDLMPANQAVELKKVKTRLEQISRLIKAQEKRVLNPVAEAVLGMEKSLEGSLSSSRLLLLLQSELKCPRCQAAFSTFEQRAMMFHCRSCQLELGVRIGQYELSLGDFVTLLSGGMTRVLEDVELPGLGRKTGRYMLDPKQNFELQFYEYQH